MPAGLVANYNPLTCTFIPHAHKKEIPDPFCHYFITFTCYKWLNLIEITNSYDLVYKSFDYLKQQGHFITGYVIMPNHVHFTAAFLNADKSINKLIGDSKRFMAYEIVKRLKQAEKMKYWKPWLRQ